MEGYDFLLLCFSGSFALKTLLKKNEKVNLSSIWVVTTRILILCFYIHFSYTFTPEAYRVTRQGNRTVPSESSYKASFTLFQGYLYGQARSWSQLVSFPTL